MPCIVSTSQQRRVSMLSTSALDLIIADVRAGTCRRNDDRTTGRMVSTAPRARLLARLEHIASTISKHDLAAFHDDDVPTRERHALHVENVFSTMLEKCSRMNACLACTLNPCICHQLSPLPLSHRLWVLTHCKEVLRTTATGKLLLLAHPRATLLVSGLPAHEAELAEVCSRSTAAVLFPSPDAVAPGVLLERLVAADLSSSACDEASNGMYGRDTSPSMERNRFDHRIESPVLDIILLDGTWNQARQLYRSLPTSLTKVVITPSRGNERSIFGTAVRKQGKQREEAGRVSTFEAYQHLGRCESSCMVLSISLHSQLTMFCLCLAKLYDAAIALGDPPAVAARLSSYLETFINALPRLRPKSAWQTSTGELPTKTPTDPCRRRARSLGHLLGRGPLSDEGRHAIAHLLRERPEFFGVPLTWRVSCNSTEAILLAECARSKRRVNRYGLGTDIAGSGTDERYEAIGRWPLSMLLRETHGANIWNRQKKEF